MFESFGKRLAGRRRRPVRRVDPVENAQHPRRHRLHAQRHPRAAGRARRREKVRPRRLRVGLGGHLGAGGQLEIVAHRLQHRGQALAAQQRRRPAPDEDGLHRRCAQPRGRQFELRPQHLQPCVGVDPAQLGRGVGVEVAVAAAGEAERHVHVDAERPAWAQVHIGQADRRRGCRHASQYSRVPAQPPAPATTNDSGSRAFAAESRKPLR